METSITSETISQETICGDPENIEIANDTEPKLTQSKEQMEIAQTRKNLMQAREVYFKYFSSQKMAHTKSTIKRRVEVGTKAILQPQPSQPQLSISGVGKIPQLGKKIKKVKKW